jgi:hypothetical protein
MAADLRKRNNKNSKKGGKEQENETLAKHAKADAALQETDETTDTAVISKKKGLTFLGKLGIFFGFPLTAGFVGMYCAFLQKMKKGQGKELNFDQDFIVPFLLGLAMVVVIGFQTGGFTAKEFEPLVAWPKVKRVKKIIYKNKKGEIVPGPKAKKDE